MRGVKHTAWGPEQKEDKGGHHFWIDFYHDLEDKEPCQSFLSAMMEIFLCRLPESERSDSGIPLILFISALPSWIGLIGLIQYKWKYSNSTCISLYIQRIIKWFYWSSPVWHPTKELALRPVSTIVYTKPVSSEGRAGHLLISFVVWSSLHVKVAMGNILNHRLLSDVLIGVSCVWRHRKKVLV